MFHAFNDNIPLFKFSFLLKKVSQSVGSCFSLWTRSWMWERMVALGTGILRQEISALTMLSWGVCRYGTQSHIGQNGGTCNLCRSQALGAKFERGHSIVLNFTKKSLKIGQPVHIKHAISRNRAVLSKLSTQVIRK